MYFNRKLLHAAVLCNNSYFFRVMLQELQQRLRNKVCPNFWIPEINLFKNFADQDFNLKIEIVGLVLKKPIRFVADGYLEYVRYLTLNCCYCGEKGYIEEVEAQYLVNNQDLREPLCKCLCPVCKCCNTDSSCLCGPLIFTNVLINFSNLKKSLFHYKIKKNILGFFKC